MASPQPAHPKRNSRCKKKTDDAEASADKPVEWPGKQAPTTQLTLFDTTFKRKPTSDSESPAPKKGQLTMDTFVVRGVR